jgi:hypothetical protein
MMVKHSWKRPFAAIVAKQAYEYVGTVCLNEGKKTERAPANGSSAEND